MSPEDNRYGSMAQLYFQNSAEVCHYRLASQKVQAATGPTSGQIMDPMEKLFL